MVSNLHPSPAVSEAQPLTKEERRALAKAWSWMVFRAKKKGALISNEFITATKKATS